jgi:hypothetical protein
MRLILKVVILVTLANVFAKPSPATPPMAVPFHKAYEQADFVGIVQVTEVPQNDKGVFRASEPPIIGVKPISILKGNEQSNLRIIWQTHDSVCIPINPKDVTIVPPNVGDEYMVFLVSKEPNLYSRLGYQWFFHKMPSVPNAASTLTDKWHVVTEISPYLSASADTVQYRLYRTRLAEEPWQGLDSNIIAADLVVVDFTRKKILQPGKIDVREQKQRSVSTGTSVVDIIDLTDSFNIRTPGVYCVFYNNAYLRFVVSDQIVLRTHKDLR